MRYYAVKNRSKARAMKALAYAEGPWFPIIFSDECDGCAKTGKPRCIEFCSNSVFAIAEGKAVVVHPEKCLSGCSACESVCHARAIQFPRRALSFNANLSRHDKGLLRKAVCPNCKKTFWTNRENDVCFDCENTVM